MNENIDLVKELCEKLRIHFRENVDLSLKTYLKTGGVCKLLISPKDASQLSQVKKQCNENNIEFIIVGESTNMIFLDNVQYGVVISTRLLEQVEFNSELEIKVGAGENLGKFLRVLYSKGYSGFEGLEGIPGTVGGAVYMNAGAYGYEMATFIKEVECVDEEGNIKIFSKEKCEFSQRMSIFRKNADMTIVSVSFNLPKESVENIPTIQKKVEMFHIARHSYQEWVFPNAGSIFTAKECVYQEYCNADKIFKIKYKLTKLLHYNKFMRFINRRSPNKIKLNELVFKHFGLGQHAKVVSTKHVNMFSNKNSNSWELLSYIYSVKNILKNRVVLENEIVTKSIISDPEKMMEKHAIDIELSKQHA